MSVYEDSGERLREASCVGDLDLVTKLLSQGGDVNSQNPMNGWTPLHWACKRNHVAVASFLKKQGANGNVLNKEGCTPGQLSTNTEIRQLFGVPEDAEIKTSKLPITPNYMANPVFPYSSSEKGRGDIGSSSIRQTGDLSRVSHPNQELVLKVRVANCEEKDFIEVELDQSSLSFSNLVNLMCSELKVDEQAVTKVRKLPDTIVRKDKDVLRLKQFQELELVLTSRAMSASSRAYNNIVPAKNNETILY